MGGGGTVGGVQSEHTAKKGEHKTRPECTLRLMGGRVVDRIIPARAVWEVTADGLVLVETAEGVDEEELRQKTGVEFRRA